MNPMQEYYNAIIGSYIGGRFFAGRISQTGS